MATASETGGGQAVLSFIKEYSLLLLSGAVLALLWANLDYESYHHLVEYNLWTNDFVGHLHDGHRELTVHYLINDILMALFFAIAGKEVWEEVALKKGKLRGRKALTPLIATAGGMIGPVAIYFLIAFALGKFALLSNGWAVPTATDIAFSFLVGRLVFGAGHPAVSFLLLLAIADDAAGLIIIAVAYPTQELRPEWLLLSIGAAAFGYLAFNWLPRWADRHKDDADKRAHARLMIHERRPDDARELHGHVWENWVHDKLSFWPWAVLGATSWYGFQLAGVHPALGLLPVIPAIPHAEQAFGFFAEEERFLDDTLNRIEHALKPPVEVILFFFGLANAGVALSSINEATFAVLGGLLIGKPLGIYVFGVVAAYGLRLGLPEGMTRVDLFVVGCVAAIGFTVSLFVAAVAFKAAPPEYLDGAKMGALMSFSAALIAWLFGRALGAGKPQTG